MTVGWSRNLDLTDNNIVMYRLDYNYNKWNKYQTLEIINESTFCTPI